MRKEHESEKATGDNELPRVDGRPLALLRSRAVEEIRAALTPIDQII